MFVHNRDAIRHYVIEGDTLKRIDPIALSPRSFVDEWLTRDWKESAQWSESSQLQSWHARKHADLVSGLFAPTMHCRTQDLWQVGIGPLDQLKPDTFYLVRWRPPYQFRMVQVRNKPFPHCTQPDPSADDWRTLFSIQGWRN